MSIFIKLWAKGKRQKAKGKGQKDEKIFSSPLPFALYLLPFILCLLSFALYPLPFAFC
jgi:hypothetical protein